MKPRILARLRTASGHAEMREPVSIRDPIAELAKVRAAADITADALARGEGVAVHCRGGRGRAGTVIGLALTKLGHRPNDVVAYLDRLHKTRGKGGWPESPWQAEVIKRSIS